MCGLRETLREMNCQDVIVNTKGYNPEVFLREVGFSLCWEREMHWAKARMTTKGYWIVTVDYRPSFFGSCGVHFVKCFMGRSCTFEKYTCTFNWTLRMLSPNFRWHQSKHNFFHQYWLLASVCQIISSNILVTILTFPRSGSKFASNLLVQQTGQIHGTVESFCTGSLFFSELPLKPHLMAAIVCKFGQGIKFHFCGGQTRHEGWI